MATPNYDVSSWGLKGSEAEVTVDPVTGRRTISMRAKPTPASFQPSAWEVNPQNPLQPEPAPQVAPPVVEQPKSQAQILDPEGNIDYFSLRNSKTPLVDFQDELFQRIKPEADTEFVRWEPSTWGKNPSDVREKIERITDALTLKQGVGDQAVRQAVRSYLVKKAWDSFNGGFKSDIERKEAQIKANAEKEVSTRSQIAMLNDPEYMAYQKRLQDQKIEEEMRKKQVELKIEAGKKSEQEKMELDKKEKERQDIIKRSQLPGFVYAYDSDKGEYKAVPRDILVPEKGKAKRFFEADPNTGEIVMPKEKVPTTEVGWMEKLGLRKFAPRESSIRQFDTRIPTPNATITNPVAEAAAQEQPATSNLDSFINDFTTRAKRLPSQEEIARAIKLGIVK